MNYFKIKTITFIIIILLKILIFTKEYSYCDRDPYNRIDCAADISYLTKEICENELGCCYGELEDGSVEPWCFFKRNVTTIPTVAIMTTIYTTIPSTIYTTITTANFTTIPTTIYTTEETTIYTKIPKKIHTTIPTLQIFIDYSDISSSISSNIKSALLNELEFLPPYHTEIADNYINNNYTNLIDIYNYNYYFNYIITSNNIINNDRIVQEIKKRINDNTLDFLISKIIEKENKDLIIQDNKHIYQLTSSFNQNNNIYNNISNINLGLCENLLKQYYNISDNSSLLIFKMDLHEEGFLIPIIEYEVYNIITKEKLDLNICKDIKIDINIPVKIDEKNLFKYNSSSEYYNDNCYPYTTEKNTDITLKDRRNEFINNNLSLCEKDCEYNGYNYTTKNVLCECYIKIKFPLISEIKINKDLLLRSFKDIKTIININIMKCYYILFKKEGIVKNIGNYIISVILIITIILCILFIIKGYKKIKLKIYDIIKKKEINDKKEKSLGEKEKNVNTDTNKGRKINKDINSEIVKINKIKKKRQSKIKRRSIEIKGEIINKPNTKSFLKNSKTIMVTENNKTNNILKTNNISNVKKEDILIMNNIMNNNNKIEYNDYEFNNLEYSEALKLDKRTYIQYYLSLLKMKHIIIFTFYTKNDYNSRKIKIILFLFSFSLYLTINALFFNDNAIHKIFVDSGSFNFEYQIPQIIYSTIITSIINTIINYLSLSEKNILELKKHNENPKEKGIELLDFLKLKFIIFFVFVFSFLLLFWYYLSCFCVLYKNTQIHLIKDTLISFSLSFIYSFGLYLLPGIFRIPSLKSSKKEHLYIISKIIQLI